MDYTLELIVVPVSDVDRAKAFYLDQVGFELRGRLERTGPDFRVVQLTPPGSACSIAIGTGIGSMAPGSLHGLHLVRRATSRPRATSSSGAASSVGEPFHFGEAGQTPGLDPERRSYATFMPFQDPDGNTWLVQEVKRDWVLRQVKRRRGRRVTDRGRDRVRRWGVRVRGPHRAIPARAPRPLLPDARLVRRGRGRGPGDVPAGVAGARLVRRQRARPGVAVPDRDERLPRRLRRNARRLTSMRYARARCRG